MKGFVVPVFAAILAIVSSFSSSPKCKCFPGDTCWPTRDQWSSLNRTVGGRLIATVPLGQACHDPNYNAELCVSLQSKWQEAPIQYVYFVSLKKELVKDSHGNFASQFYSETYINAV